MSLDAGEGGEPPIPVDSLDCFGTACSLPERLARWCARPAWPAETPGWQGFSPAERSAFARRGPAVTDLVVLGEGPGALAGELLGALAAGTGRRPVVVPGTFEPPRLVSPSSLVFVVSGGGGDRTDAQAAAARAWALGASVVVVGAPATGAGTARGPWCDLGDAAAAASVVDLVLPMVEVTEGLGLTEGVGRTLAVETTGLAERRDQLAATEGPAKALARRIGRTFPLIHGAGPAGPVAARWWKFRCNTWAKVPAFADALPGLAHGELAGWGQHGDVTRQLFTLLRLRTGAEDAATTGGFDLVAEQVDEVVSAVVEVDAALPGALGGLIDHLLTADFVALFLAGLEGTDPGPVPATARYLDAQAGRA